MIGVNVAKAEKIIWMVYAETKSRSDPVLRTIDKRQSVGHRPSWPESSETTDSWSHKPP